MRIFFPVFVFLFFAMDSWCQVLTFDSHLEQFISTEYLVIDSLKNYMKVMTKKVEETKIYLELLERENKMACQKKEEYFHDPIAAYATVKRLTIDWDKMKKNMISDPGVAFVRNIEKNSNQKFPTEENLSETINGLLQLQDTYNLHPSEIAKGEFNGTKHDVNLSAKDCFDIGLHAYNQNDFSRAILWLSVAYDLCDEDLICNTLEKSQTLKYLAESYFKEGDVKSALIFTNLLLRVRPEDEKARLDKIHYEKILKQFEKVDEA